MNEDKNNKGSNLGRYLAWIGLITLLVILGLGLVRNYEGSISPGSPSPEFVLTTFNGETISSDDLLGKVIVINFWASWCKTCEIEAAELEEAWQIYRDSGEVIFLGVDYVDTETDAMGYLHKYGISYPNGPDYRPDLGTTISQAFRIRGVPETYIVGTDGIISHAQIGPFVSLAQIQSYIDPLLPGTP